MEEAAERGQGMIQDFLMNDKCSAGTGKFLEIMANRLGVTIAELFDLAVQGTAVPISSLCTVEAMKDGRYAGALGASLLAKEKKK